MNDTVPDNAEDITGLILAGGRATRMGGQDKGLITVAGRPMAAHILTALRPQVAALLINANRNLDRYAELGAPVVSDQVADFAGPLAGMASGLGSADTAWMVTAPCDSPLIPPDLVARLIAALRADDAELAVAWGEGRMQPVFALLPRRLLPSLNAFLQAGERKIDRWYAQHRVALADLSDRPEMFLNINTPEERDALEARLTTG
ncbi:MAG: molybdenum cofactor guanylyltransferase MobA [Aquisalimonadaceae bacterium]